MSSEHIAESPFRVPRGWFRQHLSDAEYIQMQRRQIQWMQEWRWAILLFHGVMIVVWIFVSAKMYDMLLHFASFMPTTLQSPPANFGLGIVLGAKVGFCFVASVIAFAQSLSGNRQAKLLVEYHDQLAASDIAYGDSKPSENIL